MSKFLIEFRVHIVEDKRPKDQDFKSVYRIDEIYTVDEDWKIGNILNERYETLIKQPGLTVFKDPTRIQVGGLQNVSNRMFIPWHMIAYFDGEIKLIPETAFQPLDSLAPADQTPTPEKEIVH